MDITSFNLLVYHAIRMVRRNTFAAIAGALVALLGTTVLIGWQFKLIALQSVLPHLPVMTPNTAIGLVALGLALFLLSLRPVQMWRWMVFACLAVAIAIGCSTLLEYSLGRDFNIDSILFRFQTRSLMIRHPGRPSPQTCICLLLLGTAMGIGGAVHDRHRVAWVVQILAAMSLALTFIAGTGYLFDVTLFYGVSPQVGMALQTIVAMGTLAAGLLAMTSNAGFISEIFGDSPGGYVARRVLPVMLLVPLLAAAILFRGERLGFYDSAFAAASLVVSCIIIPAGITIRQVRSVNRQEMARLTAEEKMQQQKLQLFQEQSARTAAESSREQYRQLADERDRLLLSETAARKAMEEATQAKDAFLAILSHELRTPLTPVLLTVSLIERQNLSEDMRHDIQTVRENVELEARLIDDLLDLTGIVHRKLRLNPESLDVHELIRSAVTIRSESDVAITLSLAAKQTTVMADPVRLKQVFWKLLNNARKFTPATGQITVATDSSDRSIRVVFADTGLGIAPELLARVFDPFDQKTPRSHQDVRGGLGLGLAIARGLIEAHGGSILATSAGTNLGATFVVELPLARASEQTSSHCAAARNF